MPLSPHTQALVAAVGLELTAEQSATDEAAIQAVTAEVAPFERKFKEQKTQVTQLSAEVTSLKGRLTAAEADAAAKQTRILELSADAPRPADPLVVSMFAETFDAKREQAIEAGAPAAAVDYFANLCRGPDGQPTVLALSACTVPCAEAGKTRSSRLGIAVLDGLARLAKGGFGQGVPTGVQQPGGRVVAQMSADGTGETDNAKVVGDVARKHVEANYGHHAQAKAK